MRESCRHPFKICVSLLLFCTFTLATVDVPILPRKSSGWRYYLPPTQDLNGPTGTSRWETLAFDDSAWSVGTAPFGYGDVTTYGTEFVPDHDKNSYYRYTFTVTASQLALASQLAIRTATDNTGDFYLNGALVGSDPAASHEFAYWNYILVNNDPVTALRAAPLTNVVAVRVENGALSSDTYMDLELALLFPLTAAPSTSPTRAPTDAPSAPPTALPTRAPTTTPTRAPTDTPTRRPTVAPTSPPSVKPSSSPTASPTASPHVPTEAPSSQPTSATATPPPTLTPTSTPTSMPTKPPTSMPTVAPSLPSSAVAATTTNTVGGGGSSSTPPSTDTSATLSATPDSTSPESMTSASVSSTPSATTASDSGGGGGTTPAVLGETTAPYSILSEMVGPLPLWLLMLIIVLCLFCCCCIIIILLLRRRRQPAAEEVDIRRAPRPVRRNSGNLSRQNSRQLTSSRRLSQKYTSNEVPMGAVENVEVAWLAESPSLPSLGHDDNSGNARRKRYSVAKRQRSRDAKGMSELSRSRSRKLSQRSRQGSRHSNELRQLGQSGTKRYSGERGTHGTPPHLSQSVTAPAFPNRPAVLPPPPPRSAALAFPSLTPSAGADSVYGNLSVVSPQSEYTEMGRQSNYVAISASDVASQQSSFRANDYLVPTPGDISAHNASQRDARSDYSAIPSFQVAGGGGTMDSFDSGPEYGALPDSAVQSFRVQNQNE